MDTGCCYGPYCYPACPPLGSQALYNEVSHQIGNNSISIKVGKNTPSPCCSYPECIGQIDPLCVDAYGKKCREGCTKVNVIPNQQPPPKKPDEETFCVKATRQFLPSDDLKNSLEIEFRGPRNYMPLPEPGPPPPIIIPKCNLKRKRKYITKCKDNKKSKKTGKKSTRRK